MAKGPDAFRTISEAAAEVGVPQHVLRFWETRLAFIKPMKRAGGRRFYRPQDVAVLRSVRALLHEQGLSIKAVQTLHRAKGAAGLRQAAAQAPTPASKAEAIGVGLQSAVLSASVKARLRGVLDDLEAVKARVDQVLAVAG